MSVLNDEALSNALSAIPPLASDIEPADVGRKDSKIQPASLDLTIGKIIVPDAEEGKPGSLKEPLEELGLAQGQTAVVVTLETLHLPDDIAAIGFPPSSVSLAGLLMTNPGHIDPGYDGELKFTVINMGRKPYPLKKGDLIVTLVFLEMVASAAVPYGSRLASLRRAGGAQLNNELLERLSPDFLDVDARAQRQAVSVVTKAQLVVPILAALFGILGTILTSYLQPFGELKIQIAKIEGKVDAVGSKVDLGSIDKRLNDLEDKVGKK